MDRESLGFLELNERPCWQMDIRPIEFKRMSVLGARPEEELAKYLESLSRHS